MDRIKQYLLKHIKDTIVLSILGAVVFVNYFVYSNKLAFLDMFYLLVVLAGYYIGKRFAILGAFFIILMVWVFILADGNKYYSIGNTVDANINLMVWGGFLILAAWLIGTLSENLRRELQASQRLREDLNHERELLSISNRQLRDYSFRLEERVAERTEELKRSNRELMDFAAIASHDLQEPLRKIVMFGDRLEDKISSQDVKSHDYLDRMRKAARRMQGFIEDLLKLSAIATGGRPFQTVNLQTLAQEVAEDLEARIAQSNAQLNIDHLPTLEADATQMRQLLQNLIGNALKYHRDGVPPVVTVTSRPLRDGFWEIMVGDNGIGIEPHQINRIFQPFERLHSRGLFDGSGMGLTICKKIVGRHGGSIHVASQPNEGTKFIITLPEQHKAPRNRNEQSPQVSSV